MAASSDKSHHAKVPVDEEDEDAMFIRAVCLIRSPVLPMALKAAIELNVLEIIAQAGSGAQLSVAEIVDRIPTTNPEAPETLDRLLKFLASGSVLTCSLMPGDDGEVQWRYGLAPVCRFLTKNKDGVSMAEMVLMTTDKVHLECWHHLKYAVLEGAIPFNKAHGTTLFEYLSRDLRSNQLFNQAMSAQSSIMVKKMLGTYKGFEGINVLVDVGGGIGTALGIIVSKYPHIKGINFDLPHVISDAPSLPGVEHLGGDMFANIPTGDTILLKWILHDWSDEHCVKLLKKCWEALPDSGKVIIADDIRPEAPETDDASHMVFSIDLCMLTLFGGAKERTKTEFESLAKQAGFSRIKFMCRVFTSGIVEFHK